MKKAAKIGFANGFLFGSGNLMSAVSFLYSGYLLRNLLIESTKKCVMNIYNTTTFESMGDTYSAIADYPAVAQNERKQEWFRCCGVDVVVPMVAVMLPLLVDASWMRMLPP